MAPSCPADGTAMDERTVYGTFQGVPIDFCPECAGVFLDGGELGQLLGQAAPKLHREPKSGASRGLACPKCEKEMVATDVEGVEVDLCPSCASVWLDRGELAAVQQAAEAREAEEDALADAAEGKNLRALLVEIGDN